MAGIKAEFTFSPRILEHLGISAYNSVRKCLAELVANSYDADANHVTVSIPDVIDESAAITLTDDGVGMSTEDLKSKFLRIGRDRRKDGDRTESGRLVIGSKGIGSSPDSESPQKSGLPPDTRECRPQSQSIGASSKALRNSLGTSST